MQTATLYHLIVSARTNEVLGATEDRREATRAVQDCLTAGTFVFVRSVKLSPEARKLYPMLAR